MEVLESRNKKVKPKTSVLLRKNSSTASQSSLTRERCMPSPRSVDGRRDDGHHQRPNPTIPPLHLGDRMLSYEDLDLLHPQDNFGQDPRLSHASTTECLTSASSKGHHKNNHNHNNPGKKHPRPVSSISSQSSLSGSLSTAGTSSNFTLSSAGSSFYEPTLLDPGPAPTPWPLMPVGGSYSSSVTNSGGATGGRRHSSNSRFNEYIASTSSWDWEDEPGDGGPDYGDVADLQDPFPAYRRRRRSYRNSISNDQDDLITFDPTLEDGERVKVQSSGGSNGRFEEVNTPGGSQNQVGGASLASAGVLRASCPTLNQVNQSKKGRGGKLGVQTETSKSTFDIGKVQEVKSQIGTSKSTNYISQMQKVVPFLNTKKPITLRYAPSGLTESSRVVWMADNGYNHPATVKWVGKIRDKFYAGVEFEKPIGNSSGIYGYGHGLQVRLFTCKLGYGRFIPVDQLILYEDFYEDQKTGFICIICRDDFIEPGQAEDDFDTPEKIMVATKCGHLFHRTCLYKWFNEKASSASHHCPYCHARLLRNDLIRIFPAQVK